MFRDNQGLTTLLIVVLSPLTACESCDFSYGQVNYTVHVAPASAEAEVVLCTEQEGCRTAYTGPESDTGQPQGTVAFWVSHAGYAVCKAPAYQLTVSAPGCVTVLRSKDDTRLDEAVGVIEIDLSCEG